MCGTEYEYENVVHVLWECTAYSSSRATEKLQELLGDSYADFDLLSNVEKTSYVLGSEHWENPYFF